jgi:hypothetical protein
VKAIIICSALFVGRDEKTADDGNLYFAFTLFSVDLQGLEGSSFVAESLT